MQSAVTDQAQLGTRLVVDLGLRRTASAASKNSYLCLQQEILGSFVVLAGSMGGNGQYPALLSTASC